MTTAEALALPSASTLDLLSVTSACSVAGGEAAPLVYWKLGAAADRAIDSQPVIQAMLRSGDRPGARKYIVDASEAVAGVARDRGTRFHDAVEAISLGQAPRLDAEIEPYVRQWWRWMDRYQPEVLMAEAPVYHPGLGYAGTLDGIWKLPGWDTPLVYDYKTTDKAPDASSRPPYEQAAWQLSAYAHATEVGVLKEQRYSGRKRYYVYDPTVAHEALPQVDLEVGLAIIVSPWDIRACPTVIGGSTWESWQQVLAVAQFRIHQVQHLFRAPLTAPEPAADRNPLLD